MAHYSMKVDKNFSGIFLMTELINKQNKLVTSFYLRLLFFEQFYRDRNRNFVMKSHVKGLESYYQKMLFVTRT
jgi:hypothetical protein